MEWECLGGLSVGINVFLSWNGHALGAKPVLVQLDSYKLASNGVFYAVDNPLLSGAAVAQAYVESSHKSGSLAL